MGPLFTVFNSRELATATNIYTPAPPALNPDYIRHDEPLHTEWALTELDHGIFVAAYLAIVAGIAWYTIGRFFIREPKRDIS